MGPVVTDTVRRPTGPEGDAAACPASSAIADWVRTTTREEHGRGRDHHTGDPLAGWEKPELDLSKADWQSGSQGLGDVQIAFVEGFIALRNGGRPTSSSLIFSPAEWRAFVLGGVTGSST